MKGSRTCRVTLLVWSLGFFPSIALSAPVFETDLIFPPEDYHNHSSSIVETADGDLIAAWFHGKGEKTDDTLAIWGARKRKGADSWSEPFLMADNKNLPDQNPVLFIDPQKRLWLFWISSLANTIETYLLEYRYSTDYSGDGPPKWEWNDVLHCRPKNIESVPDRVAATVDDRYGESFDSEEKYRSRLKHAQEVAGDKLFQRLGWMPRCQPVMLSDKRMAIGLYSDTFLTSVAAFTEDGGMTWEFGEAVVGYGLIQPSLIQKNDGAIVAYGRDKAPSKRIRVAQSQDGGMSWSPVRDMEIPNPDSSVSVRRLENGGWILVCNDLDGKSRHGRSRLTAYLSDDEGETWKWNRRIEDNPDDVNAAYPTVIQTVDGAIHCVYTYTPKPKETIKHVWFNEDWIREGDQR